MAVKTIAKGRFLIVRGTKAQGLTERGRTMRSPLSQIVDFKSPNIYSNLLMEHVTGPMKGVTILFSSCKARKAKIRSSICLCDAYTYPHNKGTGLCPISK